MKHEEFRKKFGNVVPTDNACDVLEAVEQWLIERESKQSHKPVVSGGRPLDEELVNEMRIGLDKLNDCYVKLSAARASGAVDKTVSEGLYCNCTLPNRNTTGNWCGTCNKMIVGSSAGRF